MNVLYYRYPMCLGKIIIINYLQYFSQISYTNIFSICMYLQKIKTGKTGQNSNKDGLYFFTSNTAKNISSYSLASNTTIIILLYVYTVLYIYTCI